MLEILLARKAFTFGIIPLGLLFFLFVGTRMMPCQFEDVGRLGMNTWGRVAPNLACSLVLEPDTASGLGPLGKLPSSIGNFTNARSLKLKGNNLTSLPPSIGQLTQLQVLELDDNKLTSLPKEVGGLKNLQQLTVSGNPLKDLPPEVTSLVRLTKLEATRTELAAIPSDIGNLTSLETLAMGGTFSSVPGTIGNLSSLTSLSINANVSSLPPEIGSLPNLSNLNLSGNNFASLPAQLSSLPSLSQLNLAGNPFMPEQQAEIVSTLPSATVSFVSSAGSSAASVASSAAQAGGGATPSAQGSPQPSSVSSPTSSLPSLPGATITTFQEPVPPGIDCSASYIINGYTLCTPSSWTVDTLPEEYLTKPIAIKDGGVTVAEILCPMKGIDYQGWTIRADSRRFQKDGQRYGTDIWSAERNTERGTERFLLLFMHRNSLNSWYGANYQDINASCQIQSKRPELDVDLFRVMHDSVQ